jgi:hypothetical protein
MHDAAGVLANLRRLQSIFVENCSPHLALLLVKSPPILYAISRTCCGIGH